MSPIQTEARVYIRGRAWPVRVFQRSMRATQWVYLISKQHLPVLDEDWSFFCLHRLVSLWAFKAGPFWGGLFQNSFALINSFTPRRYSSLWTVVIGIGCQFPRLGVLGVADAPMVPLLVPRKARDEPSSPLADFAGPQRESAKGSFPKKVPHI